MSAMAASQSGLPLGFASRLPFASELGGTLAHLSANALDAAAHLDQSNVAQSFGAHDAFMSSMAASHSGDLAASGPAPKTFLNTATRSIIWGPGPCGGPCGPLGAHFSKTSLNSLAHSSLTNSNLAIAWSLVMVPASKAALMAPILVAHSSLTSAISSRHFLTHGGLGPNGGWGPGWGPGRGPSRPWGSGPHGWGPGRRMPRPPWRSSWSLSFGGGPPRKKNTSRTMARIFQPLWTPWGRTSTGWPSNSCGCSGGIMPCAVAGATGTCAAAGLESGSYSAVATGAYPWGGAMAVDVTGV
mmetsp:Transcript_3076/g.13851  ORF Transcript_3076/g.13851 Transcript_3076/m.13851 type:complete len:299 (-) Transcript_3076:41-937(-)